MQPAIVISNRRCWEYGQPGHPEAPERVKNTYAYLNRPIRLRSGLPIHPDAHRDSGLLFIEPGKCNDEDILLVHTKKMLNEVKTGKFYDSDTPSLPNIYEYALLAASGAITAMEYCLSKNPAFSLMRPPGHHATKNSLGGFCYFNNIAIAVKKLLNKVQRVAILDIDCHHGNGTQDIFLGSDNTLYVSLHQVPLYPGTGLTSEKNCLNFPLAQGTDEKVYLSAFETAVKEVNKFKPDAIAVSAGFDTYENDPLTGLNLEKSTYKKIAEIISSLNLPRFAVLEGGYSDDLPECIYNFLTGFV